MQPGAFCKHLTEAVNDIQCHRTKIGAQRHVLFVQVGRNHRNIGAFGICFHMRNLDRGRSYIGQMTRNQKMQFVKMPSESRAFIEFKIGNWRWSSVSSAFLLINDDVVLNAGQGR